MLSVLDGSECSLNNNAESRGQTGESGPAAAAAAAEAAAAPAALGFDETKKYEDSFFFSRQLTKYQKPELMRNWPSQSMHFEMLQELQTFFCKSEQQKNVHPR